MLAFLGASELDWDSCQVCRLFPGHSWARGRRCLADTFLHSLCSEYIVYLSERKHRCASAMFFSPLAFWQKKLEKKLRKESPTHPAEAGSHLCLCKAKARSWNILCKIFGTCWQHAEQPHFLSEKRVLLLSNWPNDRSVFISSYLLHWRLLHCRKGRAPPTVCRPDLASWGQITTLSSQITLSYFPWICVEENGKEKCVSGRLDFYEDPHTEEGEGWSDDKEERQHPQQECSGQLTSTQNNPSYCLVMNCCAGQSLCSPRHSCDAQDLWTLPRQPLSLVTHPQPTGLGHIYEWSIHHSLFINTVH